MKPSHNRKAANTLRGYSFYISDLLQFFVTIPQYESNNFAVESWFNSHTITKPLTTLQLVTTLNRETAIRRFAS
jgi:hypothetical protein